MATSSLWLSGETDGDPGDSMQVRSMSSGLMPLPVLPMLARLGGDDRSPPLLGRPSPPDSFVLLSASNCRSCIRSTFPHLKLQAPDPFFNNGCAPHGLLCSEISSCASFRWPLEYQLCL